MRAVLRFICFAFYVSFCNTAAGQYQELSFNHLSVNNGLSQGVNNCIFKDSRDYIWISSFDGLNRFDGINCVIYRDNPFDSFSVKGTLFLNILEDRDNNLWIGSNEGLNFYNRKLNRFQCYYNSTNRLSNQTYSPFYIDDQNNIWLQSGQNILLFNSATKQFTPLYQFPVQGNLIIRTLPAQQLQPLQKIFAARKGDTEIYASDAGSGLHFEAQNTGSVLKAGINTFLNDADGFWIGTDEGLFHQKGSEMKHIPLQSEKTAAPNILYLHTDNKNILWAGTEKDGIFYVTKENSAVQKQYTNSIYNPYSISGNQVQYIYTDKENNLWAAVWGKGADYVNLEKFRFPHYLTSQETNKLNLDNFIRSVAEVKPGRFWCGTQLNGILVLDGNKKITGRVTEGLPPSVEHIYKDSREQVWIATFSGLFRADPQTEKVLSVTGFGGYSKAARQFNYVYELQNKMLAASTNAGIFFIMVNGNQNTITKAKGIPENDVYLTSFQTASGDIYLCRAFKGFSVYRLQQDSLVLKKDFYDQATVKCFYETADSILWIAGTKGLIKFNKNSLSIIKTYTTGDGLRNQYIYGILAHEKELWLSTNAGISKFNTADNSFKNFTEDDGLQSNEFNTYSFCRSSAGELLFGGVNGINAFYPSHLKKDSSSPRILLQNIFINDTTAKLSINPEEVRELDLRFSQNTLSFQFAVIDYTNPARCSFLYKLDGYDKDWISSANKSIIRYANLPPGTYTLKAKAVSDEGIVNNSEYAIKITVATPWHKTWWFRLLLFAAAALLVFYFIKSYVEKQYQEQKLLLEKELAIEQERTRLARELHDGLGSMLSGIKHSFTAMKNQLNLDESQDLKFHSNIDKLNESIKELRTISHSMASEGLLQYGIENSLSDFCSSMHQPGVLNVSFKAIDTAGIQLTQEASFNIFRIVQELMQNIIKHSGARNVIVQVNYNAGHLYITVEDDGSGFNPEAVKNKGMGLKNIESRIKMLKGKMDYRTALGEGTSVLIEVPCKTKELA